MRFKAWCRWCRYRITWSERLREWEGGPLRPTLPRRVCALAPYCVHDPNPERP